MADSGTPNNRVRMPSRPASSAALFASRAIAVSTAGFSIKGGRWWYGSASAIDLNVGGTACSFVDVRYWDSDGFDGFGTGTKTFSDSFGGWCGVGISTGSQGDVSSCHNGTANRDRILAVMGDKSGVGDTNQCVTNNNHVIAIGRNRPFAIFDNDATQGAQVFTNSVAVVIDGGDRPYVQNDGGLLTLRFITIHGIGSATGKEGTGRSEHLAESVFGQGACRSNIIKLGIHAHKPRADCWVSVVSFEHFKYLVRRAETELLLKSCRAAFLFHPAINCSI